jgi:hypothetical protein
MGVELEYCSRWRLFRNQMPHGFVYAIVAIQFLDLPLKAGSKWVWTS